MKKYFFMSRVCILFMFHVIQSHVQNPLDPYWKKFGIFTPLMVGATIQPPALAFCTATLPTFEAQIEYTKELLYKIVALLEHTIIITEWHNVKKKLLEARLERKLPLNKDFTLDEYTECVLMPENVHIGPLTLKKRVFLKCTSRVPSDHEVARAVEHMTRSWREFHAEAQR